MLSMHAWMGYKHNYPARRRDDKTPDLLIVTGQVQDNAPIKQGRTWRGRRGGREQLCLRMEEPAPI